VRGALPIDRIFGPGKPGAAPPDAPSDAELAALLAGPGRKRTRLAALSPSLHCSIIGTCLSTGELRRIVARAMGRELAGLSDHEIHGEGVRLAGRTDAAGVMLQKALDRRHEPAINRFAKARRSEELASLWEAAKQAGEIPGAYWAVLSHPAATDALVKSVFADVHMLSHLVGAANRADIRRLAALEAERAELERKLGSCQQRIQAADATIRQLETALAAAVVGPDRRVPQGEGDAADEEAALHRLVGALQSRLAAETERRQRAEERADHWRGREATALDAGKAEAAQAAALARELAALEAALGEPGSAAEAPPALPAGFSTLLYVGGRPAQLRRLHAFAEWAGLVLMHHDGGIEERPGLLAGLVSRADAACFPVDCVSHDAMSAIKRLCRQAAKPYVPLRSGGVGALLAGLATLAGASEAAD
jgi:hypothetical protein